MDIYDYVKSNENTKLKDITSLDALIFVRISYIHFEDIIDKLPISIGEISNYLSKIHINRLDKKLINLLKKSLRFRDIIISRCYHVSNREKEEEFTAITIDLPYKNKFISFRGTSRKLYDFKEDMNMSYKIVPSCYEAQNYVESERKYHRLYLGGHSKGGHIAMFAAFNVSYFKRNKICKIYNFDGPGFLENYKSLRQVKSKIVNYFPENSIIGRIMFNPAVIFPVKTKKQGIEAHNLYKWKVENEDFVIGNLSTKSNEFHNTCLVLLKTISKEKRENVINYFYTLILKGEISSVRELNLIKIKKIISNTPHLKKEEKAILTKFLIILFKCAVPKITNNNKISNGKHNLE